MKIFISLVNLGNHKLFIWKYDLNTLDMEEIIIDCIDITTFDGFISQ